MKLKFKKDTEFIFRDWTDNFDHSKMVIKKDTIIDVDDNESKLIDFYQQYEITVCPDDYGDQVTIEIIQESEDDINDIDELRSTDCFILINVDDVEIIK